MLPHQKIIHETEDKMKKTVEATQREFSTIRTGKASVSLLDNIKVEYYGAPTPLNHLATISTPEARLLVIQPWDTNMISEIEKAILKSELGITPNNDGKVIRLSIPQLTKERREELSKMVKKIAEEGRISLRTARHSANEHIKKLEKDKIISEDDCFKATEETQKLIERYTKKIDEVLLAKEKEIAEV
jgi:ribosome recycling factor